MAGLRQDFGGNLDVIGGGYSVMSGRGRDLGGRLEAGLSLSGKLTSGMIAARNETRRLKSEIEGLKRAQQSASPNTAEWRRYQVDIENATRALVRYKREANSVKNGVIGLEKAFGRVSKSLISINAGILGIGFTFLISSIKRVYELQERWTKAIGAFNMTMGGMTKGLGGATRAATQWSGVIRGLTGGDIQEGIQMFGEFTMAMSRTVKAGDGFSKFGLELARGFNLGGKGAGDLTRVLEQLGDSSGEATKLMGGVLVDAANAADVPVNMLAKDIAESTRYMARFGKEGSKTFVQSAAYARKFTISIEQLKSSMEGLDMFDEAAQTAAKLNTVFGTMINSMDLMMADDPAERIEMIRQQFLAQGRTFDTLTPKQVRYLAETTKLGEDQLASLLSLKNANVSYADFKKAQERTEKNELDAKKAMDRQLRATAQTMYAFGVAFDRITIAIGKAIKPLLEVFGLAKSGDKDFKSFGQRMESITITVEKFFESLARNEKWNRFMIELARDLKRAGSALADFVMDGRAADLFGDIAEGMRTFYGFVKDLAVRVAPALRPLLNIFLTLSQHLDKIVVAWAAMKGLGGLAGLAGNVEGAAGAAVGRDRMTRGARGGLGVGLGAATGMALGGTGAMAGGAVGGLIGSFIPFVGPLLGPLGAAIGKGIESLFSGPKIKSKLEEALENLAKSQEDLALSTKKLNAAQDLYEAKKRASAARDQQADAAILKLKQRKIPLDETEKRLAADRLIQIGAMTAASKDSAIKLIEMAQKGGMSRDLFKTIAEKQDTYKKSVESLNIEADKLLNNEKLKNELLLLEQQKKASELEKAITEQDIATLQKTSSVIGELARLPQFGGSSSGGIMGKDPGTAVIDKLEDNVKAFNSTKKLQEEIARRQQKQADVETTLNKKQIEIQQKQLDQTIMASVLNSDFIRSEKARLGEGFSLKGAIAGNLGRVAEESATDTNTLKRLYGLAGGGVVTRPTHALIGEAGPEAVIPLRSMARGRVSAAPQHGGNLARGMVYGGSGQTRIVSSVAEVKLDGRRVGSAIVTSVIASGE